MLFACPIQSCPEYNRLLDKSMELHSELIQLRPGGAEYSKTLESLAITDQLKNRHIYFCGSETLNKRLSDKLARKWREVYSGH